MAATTKLSKGFDPDYLFKRQGCWAGDYFDVKGGPRAEAEYSARPISTSKSRCIFTLVNTGMS